MNIGFVTSWYERGAAYVTKAYMDLVKDKHNVFVYARGGEYYADDDPNWNKENVTWAPKLGQTKISFRHLRSWIKEKKIELLFFNEQHEIDIVLELRLKMPQIKVGSYIDYYTQGMTADFDYYDFLICNTLRHYDAFRSHPESFYLPWGTDVGVFTPCLVRSEKELVFFHSCGRTSRKGTDLLINAFINYQLYKEAKLIIHTQEDLAKIGVKARKDLYKFNIEVITKTVPPPGLYKLGDVYVYPTYLEGLGLTLFEALSSGLPVVTTDTGPMNEIINEFNGQLVKVAKFITREDGYYWPLAICDEKDLADKMDYYIKNKDKIQEIKKKVRADAQIRLNWADRQEQLLKIFENSRVREYDNKQIIQRQRTLRNKKFSIIITNLNDFTRPLGLRILVNVLVKKVRGRDTNN